MAETATTSDTLLTLALVAMLGMFLLAGAIIVFFVIYQRRILAQQALHQRALLQATMETQEKEQQRIAADLHDGAGAMLSATRLYLQQWRLQPDHPDRSGYIEKADGLLDETVSQILAIVQDLRPAELESLGLAGGIRELANRLTDTDAYSLDMQLEEVPNLSPDRAMLLYRMTQELLNNALKHANASTLTVRLRVMDANLSLEVGDNGVGFDPDRLPEGRRGMGLKTLESRTELLGGTLTRHTEPGKGTRTLITAPLLATS